MKGVTSLGFVFNECNNVTKDDMAVLLKDVCLESIEVNFVAKCYTAKIAEAFADYVLAGEWEPANVVASVACDPFGNYLIYGRMKNGVEGSVEQVKNLIEKTASLPKYRVAAVNAKNFRNNFV